MDHREWLFKWRWTSSSWIVALPMLPGSCFPLSLDECDNPKLVGMHQTGQPSPRAYFCTFGELIIGSVLTIKLHTLRLHFDFGHIDSIPINKRACMVCQRANVWVHPRTSKHWTFFPWTVINESEWVSRRRYMKRLQANQWLVVDQGKSLSNWLVYLWWWRAYSSTTCWWTCSSSQSPCIPIGRWCLSAAMAHWSPGHGSLSLNHILR